MSANPRLILTVKIISRAAHAAPTPDQRAWAILLMGIALGLALGSLLLSALTGEWSWFQRAGSLMALTALLERPAAAPLRIVRQLFIILGTLIWGYGDLLGRLW